MGGGTALPRDQISRAPLPTKRPRCGPYEPWWARRTIVLHLTRSCANAFAHPTMLPYRTSQRLGSSSTVLLSVTQALAEKKQTATLFSRWSVTTNDSRFSLTSPRTNKTFLMSKPRPIRLLNDCCCSCARDASAPQSSAAAVTNDLTMVPPP